MRKRLPTNAQIPDGEQTVFFQIMRTEIPAKPAASRPISTQQQASRYLRQNWNKIEQMARDCLAKGSA